MLINNDASLGKARSVDNAGVVIFVAEDNAFAIAQCRDNADVGHIACVEHQRCFRILELCQLAFECFMQGGIACGQAAAAAAGAPLERCVCCSLLYACVCS